MTGDLVQSGKERKPNCRGAAIIGAIIVILISTIVIGTMLSRVAYQTRTAFNMKQRDVYYYTAENTAGRAVNWLKDNQLRLLPAFTQPAFDSLFERDAFTAGENDSGDFPVMTRVKIKGTQNAFIIANTESSFQPAAPDIPQGDGVSFSPQLSFGNTDLGAGKVRITLVDAVPVQ